MHTATYLVKWKLLSEQTFPFWEIGHGNGTQVKFLHILNDSIWFWTFYILKNCSDCDEYSTFLLFEWKCIFYSATQIVISKMVSHYIDTRASQLHKAKDFVSCVETPGNFSNEFSCE